MGAGARYRRLVWGRLLRLTQELIKMRRQRKLELIDNDLVDSKKIKKGMSHSWQLSQTQNREDGAQFRKDEHVTTTSVDDNCQTSSSVVMPEDVEGDVAFLINEKDISNECLAEVPTQFTRLTDSFYNVPCKELAQKLLGKILVRSLDSGLVLKGRIVETECYLGGDDKASHSYNGKVTPRNKPMYMKPGTIYVYFTYGMYFCFNISSQGEGAAVLVRAVDPLQGHEFMNSQRVMKRMSSKKNLKLVNSSADMNVPVIKPHELCNGPGKLCISLSIDEKSCNMQDLCSWNGMWIETDGGSENGGVIDFVTSTRIGIDSVEPEWALKPLRYYVYGNRSVSRRDKKQEQERLNSVK